LRTHSAPDPSTLPRVQSESRQRPPHPAEQASGPTTPPPVPHRTPTCTPPPRAAPPPSLLVLQPPANDRAGSAATLPSRFDAIAPIASAPPAPNRARFAQHGPAQSVPPQAPSPSPPSTRSNRT